MGLCCWEPRVEKHFSLQGTEQALTINRKLSAGSYKIFLSWDFRGARGDLSLPGLLNL